MKRHFLLFFIILFFSVNAFTQTDRVKKHNLGIESGFFHCSIKDDLASPVTYKGNGFPVSVSYSYNGIKNRHLLEFSYIFHNLDSKISGSFGDHFGNLFALKGRYGYFRFKRRMFNNRGSLFCGLNLDGSYFKKEYYYFSGVSEIFRELIFSLSPSIFLEYGIKDTQILTVQFSVPVLACVMRPGYSGKMDFNPDITSLHKYLRFENNFSYEFVLSKFLNLKFKYYFMYYKYPDPQKVRTSMDYISVEILYKI